MAVVDTIRWLPLASGYRGRLRAAVAQALAARPWAVAAWFYGSAARGQPARDLDIGIVAVSPSTDLDLASIADEISSGMGLLPDDIDVRLLNGADPVFLGNVLRDGELVFESDREQRVRFQIWAMNQWLDFQPAWDRMRHRVLERWAHG